MIRFPHLSALSLAFGYIVLGIAILALFATPLWFAWRQDIDTARIVSVHEDTQRLADIFREENAEMLVRVVDAEVGRHLVSSGKLILLTDASFSRITGNLPAWPPAAPKSSGTYTLTINQDGSSIQAVLMISTLPGGYNLLVGRDITRFKYLETLFWLGLAGSSVIVLIFGALVGWQIRRVLLSEIHDINQTAFAIVAGDLSRRLPTHGGKNELDELAQTVNRMLDQIEQLVHGVRDVSNAIAHDLRTPLAELRSRLEELTVIRPGTEETFAGIETAVDDVDRVIGIFNALLRLAEIDTGARRSGFVQVDLSKIASEAAEFYQPIAELKGIAFSFTSPGILTVAGDPLLLAQAIGNLIDNALKYAQEKGAIIVRAQRSYDAIMVSVSDDGPGIPDNEKSKVIERFYRGDASRGTPGVGLGLSLVAAVAKLHGGSLELSDNRPGLRATLVFGHR
jgi:signal transduction histidine kinase